MTCLIASVGILPFGNTNSLAPPAVRPPTTNISYKRLIGEAIPCDGVLNVYTVKLSLEPIARLLANSDG